MKNRSSFLIKVSIIITSLMKIITVCAMEIPAISRGDLDEYIEKFKKICILQQIDTQFSNEILNHMNDGGYRASFSYLCCENKNYILKDILKNMTDTTYRTGHITALTLICTGAKVDTTGHDISLLTRALFCNDINTIKILLQYGADPNQSNPLDKTATILFLVNTVKVARLLVEMGANVHHIDNRGNTILHNALTKKHPADLIKFYIRECNVNPKLLNKNKWSLWHILIGYDPYWMYATAALLFNEIDDRINNKNENGETPLDHAITKLTTSQTSSSKNRITKIIIVLRKYGAKTSEELEKIEAEKKEKRLADAINEIEYAKCVICFMKRKEMSTIPCKNGHPEFICSECRGLCNETCPLCREKLS